MPPIRDLVLSLLMLTLAGCISSTAERGVEARWRAEDFAPEKGVSRERDVLEALGPPSQILTLEKGSVFYYLLESTKAKGLVLLIYNDRRETTEYDRAVFFFDEQGILTEWSLSHPQGD